MTQKRRVSVRAAIEGEQPAPEQLVSVEQPTMQAVSQPDGQTAKQPASQTVKQQTVQAPEQQNSKPVKQQRIKATFYLQPEDIIAIDEMQTNRFRENGKKPEKSELVSEAIQLLSQQSNS